jgi:hypothetical protein
LRRALNPILVHSRHPFLLQCGWNSNFIPMVAAERTGDARNKSSDQE